MKKTAAADVVIIGGGIAGLWLLNRLRQSGYSAILLESQALGGGQTHKAQGIIHGGMKYALQGVLTQDAKAISDMPAYWLRCLEGKGDINLTRVPILSKAHYLWSPSKFTSKLTGFLAGATLASKVEALPKEAYPAVFQSPQFKGEVFSLNELVIDVPVLVRELVKDNQDAIYQIEPVCQDELFIDKQGRLANITVYSSGKPIEIAAQYFVFTAGAGNEMILNKLRPSHVTAQRRPLHMVLVKTPFDYPLYAHCLGLGSRPRITITTHKAQDGSSIWYLGGLLAEEGVKRDSQSQIKAAQKELTNLFPWLDFKEAEWATFFIDRAEPAQKDGLKPESTYFTAIQNMLVGWPTKLALAPKLADDILTHLKNQDLTPKWFDNRELRALPMPPLARPIWDELLCDCIV